MLSGCWSGENGLGVCYGQQGRAVALTSGGRGRLPLLQLPECPQGRGRALEPSRISEKSAQK